MNKIIIPCGYMGSGSSAVTDLISEYRFYEAANGDYEYVFMHCPNGLFDLEDKLLLGNNSVRSDEALHSFEHAMQELYSRKLWWVANYKEKLSPDFMKMTQEFIEDLTDVKSDYYWYMQEIMTPMIFVKMCFRKIIMIVTGNRVIPKRPLLYTPMRVAMPTPEEFYGKAKKYLQKIWVELGINEKNLILDQLLLPFNQHRLERYFDDNAECFVLERDPRDVFVSNKYVWTKQNCPVPYPTDVHDFCKYFRRQHEMMKPSDNPHVHVIQFEDLIYNYEETVAKIEKNIGVMPEDHIVPKKHFDPQRSIQNTQLFRVEAYKDEIAVIEKELKEYLYDFPYEKEVQLEKVF